jgi:hypothetical protein
MSTITLSGKAKSMRCCLMWEVVHCNQFVFSHKPSMSATDIEGFLYYQQRTISSSTDSYYAVENSGGGIIYDTAGEETHKAGSLHLVKHRPGNFNGGWGNI